MRRPLVLLATLALLALPRAAATAEDCNDGINVCPSAQSCTGTVNVCPMAHPRDCVGNVDVCLDFVGP